MHDDVGRLSLADLLAPLAANRLKLVAIPIICGCLALAATYLVRPTFTARTTFLPPQQQQSAAASALASLGALAGIAGGAARTPSDQYVALMQSTTIGDRIIDRFSLSAAYDEPSKTDTRRRLAASVRIGVGKKDGLLSVEVDDHDPKRAAEVANAFVDELKRMTSLLAVTEAQQRRAFFDRQMKQSRDQLALAQKALQSSGISEGALRTEPRVAAETYASLSAEASAAEVRLLALRSTFAHGSQEVTTQVTTLNALRAQLARIEREATTGGNQDYIGRYREYKYQEALFEIFARQYELARVDEAREGALIQVVDPAFPPEKKSKPHRLLAAVVSAGLVLVLLIFWLAGRAAYMHSTTRSRI